MSDGRKVSAWLALLDRPAAETARALRATYGPDERIHADACALLRATLTCYRTRFGDDVVRVYRAPGRINLRGMHVDTHGGYLNLMTHQREVMVVAGISGDPWATFVNVDDSFTDTQISYAEAREILGEHANWDAVMRAPHAEALREKLRGQWSLYLWGALVRALDHAGECSQPGLRCVVASNLPSGAGLSSSASLCVALLLALSDAAGRILSGDALILAARDAEWFTGARTGTSDQAAVVLGRPGTVVHGALLAEDFSTAGIRRYRFPENLGVLVVNTHTRRSLSGAQLARYTANRFAYSMALHAIRAELVSQGYPVERAKALDRFSRIQDPANVSPQLLVEALLALPEGLSVEGLRECYAPPNLDAEYERYFGNVPIADRPDSFDLRGPLIYGLAESIRACQIVDALKAGDGARTGMLMRLGHDGDRVVDAFGIPFSRTLSQADASALRNDPGTLWRVPGNYGASSPVLDGVVDTAMAAGALGACLTGAGLAGSVLVLVDEESRDSTCHALKSWLARDEYSARAGCAALTEAELDAAVVLNQSTAGAGRF